MWYPDKRHLPTPAGVSRTPKWRLNPKPDERLSSTSRIGGSQTSKYSSQASKHSFRAGLEMLKGVSARKRQ